MTTETLLNFISSDCRTWHLKPRLARRAYCLFDLYSCPRQSLWAAIWAGSDSIFSVIDFENPLNEHVINILGSTLV